MISMRSFASVTAWSLVFIPPFVRPIMRPRFPPFYRQTGSRAVRLHDPHTVKKGPLGLLDYEKVFCADPNVVPGFYDERGIDGEQGCLIVVRPDQYVAHVLPFDGHGELIEFLDNIFVSAKTCAGARGKKRYSSCCVTERTLRCKDRCALHGRLAWIRLNLLLVLSRYGVASRRQSPQMARVCLIINGLI